MFRNNLEKTLFVILAVVGVFLTLQFSNAHASNFCMDKFYRPAQSIQSEIKSLDQQCQRSIRDANSKRITVTRSRNICSNNRNQISNLKQKHRRAMSDYRICENKYKSYCGHGRKGQKLWGNGCETMFKQKFYPGYW